MDPNVQVALVSVLGVTITTIGVVVVAVINNRRERANSASAGVDAGLDERHVLTRVISLIAENDRKEGTITRLRERESALEEEVRMLKAENANLILKLQMGGKGL